MFFLCIVVFNTEFVNLFIVESPAKAKTIGQYLGKDFSVIASMGHIRELVPKDGSVDVDNDFKMRFQIIAKSKQQISKMSDLAKKSDKIYLASDPDREGEAISAAIYDVLVNKKIAKPEQFYRITYTEITKNAILEALKNTRGIDNDLVDAQQSRQILDYLVGFNLSPVLWRKLPGSRSAGRVQSVALRMIVDRELEIKKFVPKEYWTVCCNLNTTKKEKVLCRVVRFNDKNFDTSYPACEKDAQSICEIIEKSGNFKVIKNETKDVKQNPYPPFTTALLQQDAVRKLGFSSKKTMTIAQHLYEQGLITYMRTDGMTISKDVITGIRDIISNRFGKEYLPEKSIEYKTKQKNAQEAHEAIRPTHIEKVPNDPSLKLEKDALRLYELIWKRTVACQMKPAIFARQTLDLECKENENIIVARINGNQMKFNGYLAVYNVKNEAFEDGDDDNDDKIIPTMSVGDILNVVNTLKDQHFTNPPARYSEASLIKTLESYGIGRPSTYATIISVLQDREYVKLEKRQFIPTARGVVVSLFLKQFFSKYVEYDFTAKLEEDLDLISDGKLDKLSFLKKFWAPFHNNVDDVMKTNIETIFEPLNKIFMEYFLSSDNGGKCPKCNGNVTLKSSKFGLFFGCSNYPKCNFTLSLSNCSDSEGIDLKDNSNENKVIEHSKYGKIEIKTGKYGKYCEYNKDGKVKRSSLPNGEITDEILDFYLSLPLTLGKDEDGNDVVTNIGRFGPYVLYQKKFYSYKNKPYNEITFEKAMEVISNFKERKKTKSTSKSSSKSDLKSDFKSRKGKNSKK